VHEVHQDQATAGRPIPIRFPAMPSPEILFLLFVLGTALAISPVGREIDSFFHLRVITRADGPVYWFFDEVLDRLSSQRIAGTTLVLTGGWFAVRRRTLTPLLIVGVAEAMFAATGVVKIVLGKSATRFQTPDWWDGGLLEHGKFSMAYPSGHATESVLLWGTVLVLLSLYGPVATRRRLAVGALVWRLIIVNTVTVSWLMGRHWVSDLAAGLVVGALGLVLLVGLIERGVLHRLDQTVRDGLLMMTNVDPDTGRTISRPALPYPESYRTWLRSDR